MTYFFVEETGIMEEEVAGTMVEMEVVGIMEVVEEVGTMEEETGVV